MGQEKKGEEETCLRLSVKEKYFYEARAAREEHELCEAVQLPEWGALLCAAALCQNQATDLLRLPGSVVAYYCCVFRNMFHVQFNSHVLCFP